ncbi:MAG: Rpn family recombination-promoting nuclease/putative transposase [bacterium]
MKHVSRQSYEENAGSIHIGSRISNCESRIYFCNRFFKEVFTRRDTAKEFFLNYLPDNVVRWLDLDSLEYAKGSFIDKHLAE